MVVIGEKPRGVQRAKWVLEWPDEAYADFPSACQVLLDLFRPMPDSVPSPRVKTLRVCQDDAGVLTAIVLCDKPKYYSWLYLDGLFGMRPTFIECTWGQARGYKMFAAPFLLLMNDVTYGESKPVRKRKMPSLLLRVEVDVDDAYPSSESDDDRLM